MITSLVILAVLALLGISTMTATTTGLQIATDMEAEARSFQAAEAGLTAAASLILKKELDPNDVGPIDFTSFVPDPLSDMGADRPVVTLPSTPGGNGGCARSAESSSADQIDCSSFVVISTHAPTVAGQARNAASTTLLLGLAREEIAD